MNTHALYACRNQQCGLYRTPRPTREPCARCGWLRILALIKTWVS